MELLNRISWWKFINISSFKISVALAGVAQWTERWPVNWRVAGLIPRQGTSLGYRLGPQLGVHERQPYTDVSLSPFLPPFPPL